MLGSMQANLAQSDNPMTGPLIRWTEEDKLKTENDLPRPFSSNNVKFRSASAELTKLKREFTLIDSGATHNFCHDRCLFVNYSEIPHEIVDTASGNSKEIGKGKILLPLFNTTVVGAFLAPDFSTHIFAVSSLDELVYIKFSRIFKSYRGCSMFKPGTTQMIFEAPCSDGLYKMKLIKPREYKAQNVRRTPNSLDIRAWHDKIGRISPGRYLKLTAYDPTLPKFDRQTLDNISFGPCIENESKRKPVRRITAQATRPLQEIHIDLSRKMPAPLNCEQHVAHFMCSFTRKSDVSILQTRDQLT